MSRVRLIPLVLIAVITLGVLVTVYQVYRHLNFINPLQTRIEQNSAVKSVSVNDGNPTTVRVTLKPVNQLNGQDLQTTYHKLTTVIQSTTSSPITLEIQDRRDNLLTSDYEGIEPIIEQGIHNGTYTSMISQATKQAQKDGISSRITMDQQNLYVELWDKTGHYLYDVIPYQASQGGGAA